MKFSYELIRPLCEELLAFMEKHDFESLNDSRGHSLKYFTTHAELVRIQKERKAAPRVSEQVDSSRLTAIGAAIDSLNKPPL